MPTPQLARQTAWLQTTSIYCATAVLIVLPGIIPFSLLHPPPRDFLFVPPGRPLSLYEPHSFPGSDSHTCSKTILLT